MKTSQKIYLPFKRLIGIIGSIIGFFVCLGLLWWWVLPINLIVTKGHPFFISVRVGKNGKPFKLIKFRSMELDADPTLSSVDSKSHSKVTKFGRFLRITSIDETLQLINVFIGQMAFIGPRPLIDAHEDAETIRLRKENGSIVMRPGISGYAQIHKRGDLDPKTKAMFDNLYLKHFSLWLDTKIFIYTILKSFGAAKGR